MSELEELPKKAPDIMVYLKGSFETVMIPIDEIFAEIITFYEGGCYYDLMEKHEEYFDNLKDVIKFFNIIKVEPEFNLLRL